ncbi:transglycosylase domain-containing protein [Gymnodinialimonas ceratoperidinii]|uniref:Transglycosylase domain-containing protein n=1 Tax=Gymnodinialimonas ceratoperidinii TaxID=2856823 RepID=A0A8F6TYP7_9RHOB|nr:transglycosylase domain-containing protein [Gymnodinialimonas ceratoperidinii]QXT40172.1 transglycosylase domain-containing protein [Gymnodinialimonas ceratoperidinii]
MSPSGNGKRRLVADRRTSTTPKRTGATRGGNGGGTGGRKPRKARATRRKAPQRKGFLGFVGRVFRFITHLIWSLIWRSAAVVALIVALATGYYYVQLPDVTQLLDARARGSVTMLDRHGEVFAWRGEQFGGAITPDTASPHLVNAVVATEDRRFWRHLGVSPRGIASAIRINLSEGRGPFSGHGGSTITQQVAKLLCLGRGYDPNEYDSEADYEADCRRTTLWRKIQEVPFSFAMELRYSKAEILSVYLNRAYLGAGSRGFEAASQRYFGVPSADVNPQQSAMLAGLLSAPSYYAPTRDLQRAQERANVVLNLMEEQDYLSAEEADRARANPATLSQAASQDTGGYFADWIMSVGPDFLTGDTTEDVIIRTTFDPDIQAAAEASIQNVFAEQVREGSEAEAAIVVMSADGAVRAMVGGRDLSGGGTFNRAVQAVRQPGSAFKPFVYATALDLGWRFDDMILDAELCMDVPGSGQYCPENYTRQFYGMVTLTEALQSSLNTAAVRLSEEVGRDLVRQVAGDFGIESDLAAGPALALGASESTLIEMTGAYAGILNGGSAVRPYGMTELRLMEEAEPMFEQQTGIRERVISEDSARQLTYMMSRVVAEGSGRRAALPDRPAAGKTGTTNSARDAWFVGFTADYVAGVWMGYDDNRPLSGVTGGGLPSEIWRQAMEQIHADLPVRPLPMIDPVAEAGQGNAGAFVDAEGRAFPVNPNTGDVLRTDADGVIRGPVTPQGTRVPLGGGQGPRNIGDAVNNVLNQLFGPLR